MTIVIQYQYWDLKVSEKGFEVVLSFADVPEKLEVPFSAVRGFYDPSANFEMEFDDVKAEAEPAETPARTPVPVAEPDDPEQAKASGRSGAARKKADSEKAPKAAEAKENGGAEVVSLDSFRKK